MLISTWLSIKRLLVYITTIFVSSILITRIIKKINISNYFEWLILAIIIGFLSLVIVLSVSYLLDRKSFNTIKTDFINIFGGKKRL